MVMTTQELAEIIRKENEARNWSDRELSRVADVPISWIADILTRPPRKLDMERAQRVLNAYERLKPPANTPKLSETESALLEGMQGIIHALFHPGNKAKSLERYLTDLKGEFAGRKQQGGAWIAGALLEALHSEALASATPGLQQSLQRARDQSNKKKSLEN